MQSTDKKELSKKILCSILAAGVLSIGGVQCVWAEEYGLDRENPVEGVSNRYAAIAGSVGSVEDDNININIIGQSGDDRAYGVALASGESLTIDGEKMTISGSAVGGTEIRFIRNNGGNNLVINNDIVSAEDGITTEKGRVSFVDSWGGNVELNGSVDIEMSTDSGYTRFADSEGANITFQGNTDVKLNSVSGTLSGIGTGVYNGTGGNIVFNGESNNFNFHSEKGRIVGIENFNNNGGKITFNGNLSLEMSNGSSYNQWYQGLLAYKSTTEFNGDETTITMNNYSDISDASNKGNNLVDIQCDQDQIPTIINFNSDVTNLNINSYGESNNQLIGLVVSGTVGQANFNGDVTNITINGNESVFAAGLWAKYDGTITSSENNTLTINVKNNGFVNEDGSSESLTAGIYNEDYAGGNGHVILAGNLNITANAVNGTAAGIVSQSEGASYEGEVTVNGDTQIDVASENGTGLGVHAKDSNKIVSLNGNVDITAVSAEENSAFALLAQNGGTITVGSEGKTVSLVGDVVAEGNAQIDITADKAIVDGNIEVREGSKLTADLGSDGAVNGGVVVSNSDVEITGGNINAIEGKNSAVYVDGATFVSNNTDFNGEISAENRANITINGGTVNAVDYYENGVVDGKTEINAQGSGSNVTLNNVQINSHVSAYDGGVVNVNNSNINGYEGLEAFEGGIINLNGSADNTYVAQEYIFVGDENSKIYLNGGTLVAENLRDLLQVDFNGETLTSAVSGIVLKENGVIETKGDQIFANGVDLTSDETILESVAGEVTNNAIKYEGGTLSITDEKYSLGYANSVRDSIKNYDENSKTNIIMTGTLVTAEGENKVSVDDIANDGGIYHNEATAEASGNLLVGSDNVTGSVENIDIQHTVAGGFGSGYLDLAKDSVGMVITNDKIVTLGGSQGGSIITVDGTDANVQVVVGTNEQVSGTDSTKGSFVIGMKETSETEYTLNGSVTVNADSNLTTNGQTTITEGVTLNNGNLDAASGALHADVAVKENTTNNTITGTVNVGKLTAGSETDTLDNSENTTVINIGNSDKAANVVVKEADLNGATVFLDPAWKGNDVISNASNMAVGNTTVDGNYVVGQNSVLSFGVDNIAEAQEVFAKTGLTWGEGDITAALYIADTVDLTSGSVKVDGSLTEAPASDSDGTFTAEKGSVTMIDGSKFNSTGYAITGVTGANVTIADSAKLYIDNAKKNETYKVINGVDTGWSMDNIISDNALLKFEDKDTNDSTFNVTASYDKVDNVYGTGTVVIADVVDTTLVVGKDGDAAYDFFNAVASDKNNATKDAQVAAFNSAANMGEMGGVNHAAYSVSNAMTDAVADHLSIATHGDQDKDIWAHYVHNKENIEGISLGGINADYDLQYNGIVVGSDLYKNGKATAGIALSYIEGDVNSYNIAANTKNEAEYYGASVYGRIDNGNSAVLGDITYMHGSSDITQQNSGHKLTADADTDVFSIGVRAEQKVEAGIGHFVPYAGLRYMHIGTGNYTNSIGMSYDVDEQNLWLLPVGVTYSCEAQKGDWTIRPVVEAGYVWAMGDRDTNQTVSLNGAADGFGFDTADSGSFISRFAVEAEKANAIYSLGYEYQKGDTVKANKWMANMTFTF